MRIQKQKRNIGIALIAILLGGVLVVLMVIAINQYFLNGQTDNTPTLRNVPMTQGSDLPRIVTEDKTPEEKKRHETPAEHPKQLLINKLSVNANIVPVGVTASGAMATPDTAWDVGWYEQSAQPGASDKDDALLLDGHVNNALGTPGVFYRINTLKVGDEITVVRGDDATFTYQVRLVEQIAVSNVDMSRMMRSVAPEKQGLNLITCGGTYDHTNKTYRDRVLVYAVRI